MSTIFSLPGSESNKHNQALVFAVAYTVIGFQIFQDVMTERLTEIIIALVSNLKAG
jgi:hypothetical protein